MNETIENTNPDIKVVKSNTVIPDLEEFEGARAKIDGWEVVDMNTYFDPSTGEKLNEPIKVKKLKVFTVPLTHGTREEGEEFPIRATAIFNLRVDASNEIGLSSHPQSNIQQFFKKLKVDELKEIKDKFVTCTVDSNNWLRIVY